MRGAPAGVILRDRSRDEWTEGKPRTRAEKRSAREDEVVDKVNLDTMALAIEALITDAEANVYNQPTLEFRAEGNNNALWVNTLDADAGQIARRIHSLLITRVRKAGVPVSWTLHRHGEEDLVESGTWNFIETV